MIPGPLFIVGAWMSAVAKKKPRQAWPGAAKV